MVPCVQIAVAIRILPSSWLKLLLLEFYPYCCHCLMYALPDALNICWCDFIWCSLRSTALIKVYVLYTRRIAWIQRLIYRDPNLISWTLILKLDDIHGKSVFKSYLMRKRPDGLVYKREEKEKINLYNDSIWECWILKNTLYLS